MEAPSVDAAIAMQNGTGYGLTGGIHSLDEEEVDYWTDRVEVGNAYVNRATTGAIVRRQPFGGWKRSAIGPGAKAGGPNYVTQLGRWLPTDLDLDDERWLAAAATADAAAWASEFSVEHDPTGLAFESNVLRYRPVMGVLVRIGEGTATRELERVRMAARTAGVRLVESRALEEDVGVAQRRLLNESVDRVRALGLAEPDLRSAAFEAGVHYADDPVTTDGRIELLHYLREQAISRTTHRYGNVLN
jgi:RHH-type proline utilization regulon transcriptional repressor/proline dehydrogenase/delta 1-pyrroline-5-carboxylate dehydrogenase